MIDIEGALLNPEVAGPQCQEKKAELVLELWELGNLQRVDVLKWKGEMLDWMGTDDLHIQGYGYTYFSKFIIAARDKLG